MKILIITILLLNIWIIWEMLNAPYYDEETNRFYYKRKQKKNDKENDDPVF